ncbi:MAG: PAS domain S-box protein [Candidatus Latescibacteria bacterium]|nr:PAS domain S-box protein [Candidatus Latescibacterota bacterium]
MHEDEVARQVEGLGLLREAQAAQVRFQGLLEAAPDAIVGVDREGRIVLVNTQTERIFGYSREELLGQSVEVLIPARFRVRHAKHRAGYTSDPRTRPMGVCLDLIGRRKDGSEFPVEISLSPLETPDGLIVTSIIRDVTERKRLEAQLRQYTADLERLVDERTAELRVAKEFSETVLENANSLVLVLSAEGKVLLFNKRCEETTGYISEAIIGQDWITTFLPVDAQDQGCLILTGIIEGRMPDVWESPMLTKNGTIRTIRWRHGVILDKAGQTTGVIAIGQDVTEQRRLEEQVLQAERLAAVGRMAAQVAHEIRNPLSSIGLNIELLADEIRERRWNDSDEAKELVQVALSEIERLNDVIRDYLMFARMPIKQLRPEPVNPLVTGLVKLVRPEAKRSRVRLVSKLDPGIPAVTIDRSLVGQALLNCVRNAIEAMPDGGTLTITTRLAESRVEVSIKDTGPGIPSEHLTKVFDPFYSTKDKGTGLGLPYVRQIITEHGGHVVLQSTPSVGTTVIIQLPVASHPRTSRSRRTEQPGAQES